MDAHPVTATDLDALDAAAEIQLEDSAAHYAHVDWAREQQVEPECNAVMRYIALWPIGSFANRVFVVFPFSPALSLLGRFRS